ncbi:MAG: sigma-54-dependent Fis family transcriptional regulator [Acidobacteria bacterium]|nr:sigma-54-dependent Fis family transcriptional regulator [Acidobacteriota bacterium]
MTTTRDLMPAARILHVDDQPETHEWLKIALERKGCEVTVATDGQAALASFTTHRPDVVLLDHELPDQSGLDVLRQLKNADPLVEVVMLTGHGSVALAVESMREGAFNFVEKPVEFAVLDAVLDKAFAHRNLHAEAARLRSAHERRDGLGRLVGTSPAMRRLFDLIQLVAPTDASVLIRGENGTGKELVADAVHERSPRVNGPIIKINCGAIPSELFESELFGHKRGAFTGALADKRGLIESADRGTLLLDEIGEMPSNAQVKLLRVLQEKQVRRLGETRMFTPDFRLICATNSHLETLMADGKFREDLYFRINTVVLDIPPLRERREDIPVLAQLFLQRYAEKYEREAVRYHASVLQRLMKHVWRGNVR